MSIEFPERFNMAEYFLYHNLSAGRGGKVCLYFKRLDDLDRSVLEQLIANSVAALKRRYA